MHHGIGHMVTGGGVFRPWEVDIPPPPGQEHPLPRTALPHTGTTVNVRAVHILLECNLVGMDIRTRIGIFVRVQQCK